MKRFLSLLLIPFFLFSSAYAAKSKPTPTPAPMEIPAEVIDPPEEIQYLLDIAYQDWEAAEGKNT